MYDFVTERQLVTLRVVTRGTWSTGAVPTDQEHTNLPPNFQYLKPAWVFSECSFPPGFLLHSRGIRGAHRAPHWSLQDNGKMSPRVALNIGLHSAVEVVFLLTCPES